MSNWKADNIFSYLSSLLKKLDPKEVKLSDNIKLIFPET